MPPLPTPGRRRAAFHLLRYVQEAFGQLGAGLAIGAGFFGTRWQIQGDAQHQDSGHRGHAGFFLTEHLSQEGPERDRHRIDVFGSRAEVYFLRGGNVFDVLRSQYILKGQARHLGKGVQHGLEIDASCVLRRKWHRGLPWS